MLIFVYGTLRRGASNHAQLASARFVGMARTRARYELVDLGGYPAVVEGGHTAVIGELYEVDDELLCELDRFEDVPVLYERKSVDIALRDVDSNDDVYIPVEAYVMSRERAQSAPRIPHGDWIALQPSAAIDPVS
jgi:gamma-glutamylcyclotransferase (GGCT)/AIG2-like uncharacterized protein YtfP